MKLLKLTFIVLGLSLFGCNQTNNKNTATSTGKTADSTDNPPLTQDEIGDNEQLEGYKADSIKNVIALFKEKNIDKISSKIGYPLYREYPIPSIKNKEEFRQRFHEVFDQTLIAKIADSKMEQWSEVGWRGIMLDNGVLWMSDSDGVITAVNYQSDFEKNLRKDLIIKDKENLYASLKTFENPVYKIKTKKYLIRIDELNNDKYRYASWKAGEKESSKPDLILDSGEWEVEGSGGNHTITFVKENYTYRIYRNIIGEEGAADITLEVEKDGEIILTEDGTLIIE